MFGLVRADQRHAELIVQALKLTEATEISILGEEAKPWREEEEKEELSQTEGAEYKGLAARAR